MATSNESVSMALFCDFENVALGVRDAKYEKFDIKPVLERLLLKGSIVVKKAYCDWERYKGFKASMHEANFELIEIPHVRQSGKNSADIRLVVDALDLCYTKSHVDTFVIISGDSDFSPLVSKLRENAKRVIGVGVKQSTSDLLVANCDEFIFYDDLVRERMRAEAKREKRDAQAAAKRPADDDKRRKDDAEARKLQAVEIAVETFDALVSEQGDGGKIWASVLKSAIKRRKPDFSESYYGFRAFGNLLEEARARGLLDFGRDDRSGTFVTRLQEGAVAADAGTRRAQQPTEAGEGSAAAVSSAEPRPSRREDRQKDRRSRRHERVAREQAGERADSGEAEEAVKERDEASRGRETPAEIDEGWSVIRDESDQAAFTRLENTAPVEDFGYGAASPSPNGDSEPEPERFEPSELVSPSPKGKASRARSKADPKGTPKGAPKPARKVARKSSKKGPATAAGAAEPATVEPALGRVPVADVPPTSSTPAPARKKSTRPRAPRKTASVE